MGSIKLGAEDIRILARAVGERGSLNIIKITKPNSKRGISYTCRVELFGKDFDKFQRLTKTIGGSITRRTYGWFSWRMPISLIVPVLEGGMSELPEDKQEQARMLIEIHNLSVEASRAAGKGGVPDSIWESFADLHDCMKQIKQAR